MLANIFGPLGHSKFADVIKDKVSEFNKVLNEFNDIPDEAAAQFASGMLYGFSKGTIDERDYILGCAWSCPIVKRNLGKAFEAYNAGDDEGGN